MQRHLLFTDPWLHPAEKFRIGLKWLVDAARDCNSGAMALRLLDSSERDYAKYLITVVSIQSCCMIPH